MKSMTKSSESLTTKLARERLAALNAFIPLRNRVRDKLNQRQLAQTDFSTETEQLFSPITTATKEVTATTKPLLGALEKVASDAVLTRDILKTLPTDIVTTSRQQQRKDRMLEQILQRQQQIEFDPQEPYVEFDKMIEEVEEAAAKIEDFQDKPEIEDEDEPEPEIEDEDEPQSSIFQGKVPQKLLQKSTRDKIRAYQTEEDVINFTAEDYEKKNRDKHINSGYEDVVNTDEWIRQVFLARHHLTRIPSDGKYNIFYQNVKSKVDELKQQKAKATKKGKSGKGYSNNKIANSLHGQCPGNILSDISRLEVLVGAKRAGNNSPEIINESADICRRLFQGGLMNINLYRELIEELAENHGGYHSD